jgi:hypothetical protein
MTSAGLNQQTPGAVTAEHNQHFASMANVLNEKDSMEKHRHRGASSGRDTSENVHNDLNLFVDSSIFHEMQNAMRSWSNLFSITEITAPDAEYSVFSPRRMPFRSILKQSSALRQQPLPGLSHSSLNESNIPPYYPTSDSVWIPDAIPRGQCISSHGTDVLSEGFRKRSRDMNLSHRDPLEPDDAQDSGGSGTPSKLTRIPSFLRHHESPFFLNNNQESCCKTPDGSPPVVDIYVPSVCECGTAIVGVWYRNRPYYTHWFRHPRYAALRCMLEQNRCKNKYRPACGIHASVGLECLVAHRESVPCDTAVCHQDVAPAPISASGSAPSPNEATSFEISEENFGAVMSAEELLAPKFMSLLCMFQLVKHLDAVGIIYPSTVPFGMTPPNMKVDHVKISAHIDCERSKGFVQYRWYSADIQELVKELSSGDRNTKKVVGCCCLGHWKRKPPGRDSSRSVNVQQST